VEQRNQLFALIAITIGIITVGVVGISILEGFSFLEAFWFTIVSLTTTGYGDFVPVTTAGRVFTMLLLVTGIGFILYGFGTGVGMIVEGKLKDVFEKQGAKRKISKLEKHILVCGAGRVGQQVIQRLQREEIPFVVIEKKPELVDQLLEQGVLALEGDATLDHVLIEAGIKRARGLVAALPSDADNVFVTLTSRELNPGITIVARVNKQEAESKLFRAGANKVIAPEAIGGRRMAISILKPATVEFVETIMHDQGTELEIEEVIVSVESSLANKSLRESRIKEVTGAMVIAIMREGKIIGVPRADEKIQAGDLLIIIGTRSQLTRLEKLATGIE